VDPNNIVIEITESAFSGNYQQINNKLDVIQKLGIKIAIDDFGTGYSSLARERELNVNCLKIDKYFIDKLDHLDRDVAITGDIISMAHKLGHSVIAEGVENEKQKEYLIDFGCDYVQGYLFSKPVPEEEAVKLIKP
jgi:EAL domain-containing protein (putative c-di-GMP-specific phosphodiesterase class I)